MNYLKINKNDIANGDGVWGTVVAMLHCSYSHDAYAVVGAITR